MELRHYQNNNITVKHQSLIPQSPHTHKDGTTRILAKSYAMLFLFQVNEQPLKDSVGLKVLVLQTIMKWTARKKAEDIVLASEIAPLWIYCYISFTKNIGVRGG